MILLMIFCLQAVILGKSWGINFQCGNVTINGVFKMCKNPLCIQETAVQAFCQNVYEQVFKCPSKNIPLIFICDGIRHCENGIDENPNICKRALCKKNFFPCSEGTCITVSKLCDGFQDCADGIDESPLVCRKLISADNIACPFIFEENHSVSCYITYGYKTSVISCQGSLPPMSIAEVTCKPFYTSVGISSYQKIVCQNNGTWNRDVIKCKPDCGVLSDTQFSPLILNGRSIQPSLWPWYTALYSLEDRQWIFFCGSTLVTSNVVITAAHCLWTIPKEDIKVVAGKFFSDFNSMEPNSQTSGVQEIILHPLYQDSVGNYASDISIIILEKPFSLSPSVLPICLNLTLRNFISENDENREGVVVGMGITESASVSFNLKAAVVQIVSGKDCISNQKYEFRKFVKISSFCALGKNGTVCNGDSGGGLARKNKANGKWVLDGIVSISPKNPNNSVCDINAYSIFTNVGIYSDWIYEYVSKYAINTFI